MAKKKIITVNVGDIFAIKIDNLNYCYGQVVAEGRISDCMVIYDIISKEHPTLEEITSKPIVFLIQTVNSRIEDRKWEVIGNTQIAPINFPVYKVKTEEGFMMVRHDGEILKKNPSLSDVKKLKELESWSPVSLEKEIRAKYVTGEWDSNYDDLIYKG
jgi:patatin-like phospholipase/acyl hydrolase